MVLRALYGGKSAQYIRGKPPLLAFCPASQGQCRISLKDDDITALWQNVCPTYGVKRPIFYFCSTLRTYKNNLLLLLEKYDPAITNKQNKNKTHAYMLVLVWLWKRIMKAAPSGHASEVYSFRGAHSKWVRRLRALRAYRFAGGELILLSYYHCHCLHKAYACRLSFVSNLDGYLSPKSAN